MVTNQAYLFIIFIINGVLMGLLFDFFRISRKVFNTNNVITYIEDILFWIMVGIMLLYSIFVFNNGELRLYMFLGVIVGAVSYMLFLSSYMIKINVRLFNFLKKIIGTLILPIKFLFKILQKFLLKPVTFLIINLRKGSTNFLGKISSSVKKGKNIVKN